MPSGTHVNASGVSGALPNDGMLLERDPTGSTVFASSEYLPSARPTLQVCYTP